MLLRLDSLRRLFDELPADSKRDAEAAGALDQLLARLSGERRVWKEGRVVSDLKTRISAERNTFNSGQQLSSLHNFKQFS